MTKTALIIGVNGQDGYYLCKLLAQKGYAVWGIYNDPSKFIADSVYIGIHRVRVDITNKKEIEKIAGDIKPDEVYNFAAQTDSGLSFKKPELTRLLNYEGFRNVAEAVLAVNPQARIFQAGSAEMFGKAQPPQDELTFMQPITPYGVSKLLAHQEVVLKYRNQGHYLCTGILFNHESPRRGENFVTRKISKAVANILHGRQDHVELGNLDTRRDWGFAGDYVRAMWLMLQQDKPEDFVIATGESHTVREFTDHAARALGIHLFWQGSGPEEVATDNKGRIRVRVNRDFFRPTDAHFFCGNITKIKEVLGWKPQITFRELAQMMALSDVIVK